MSLPQPIRSSLGLASLVSLLAAGVLVFAQSEKKQAMPEEITAAMARMGETLRSEKYTFEARTIRAFSERNGHPLHIFHTLKISVDRPDKLLLDSQGDDGASKLMFDGKNATVFSAGRNIYANLPASGTIHEMLGEVVGRMDIDLPLADFFTDNPHESFLNGVESGQLIGTVNIDGSPYNHYLFTQDGDIQLELWLARVPPIVPKRLIVTYGDLPGVPRFIVEFSNWNFSPTFSESDFTFQAPTGARQIMLKTQPAKGAQPPASK